MNTNITILSYNKVHMIQKKRKDKFYLLNSLEHIRVILFLLITKYTWIQKKR